MKNNNSKSLGNEVPQGIDVKKRFYVFYYVYKNAIFNVFFIFWNVFYFLMAKFVSY